MDNPAKRGEKAVGRGLEGFSPPEIDKLISACCVTPVLTGC
jgi:hypothetical protein